MVEAGVVAEGGVLVLGVLVVLLIVVSGYSGSVGVVGRCWRFVFVGAVGAVEVC